jgi:hypothetical protein
MMNIEIGDWVTFNESDWFQVTNIIVEEIKTRKKGTFAFIKLYFGDKHQPMYTHSVLGVKKS